MEWSLFELQICLPVLQQLTNHYSKACEMFIERDYKYFHEVYIKFCFFVIKIRD
jgi:hypothetical protein